MADYFVDAAVTDPGGIGLDIDDKILVLIKTKINDVNPGFFR